MQTLSEIRTLLADRGLRPKHRIGQHFLHDKNQLRRLVEAAGVGAGDLVLEVDNTPVTGMANMLRHIWSLGEAGIEVPLIVFRDRSVMEIQVTSASRSDYYKAPMLH